MILISDMWHKAVHVAAEAIGIPCVHLDACKKMDIHIVSDGQW